MKQKGRSMIEMLGVLAIIGVLSIGGIALYSRAVNNHHANTILDDVNRFAFVIMESNRAFSTNAFIDNVEYSQTSTYNLDAFLGASSGQFGIVVTDVPKGVCEPLVDKAHIDYKVRVLSANTAESIEQLSASGLIYDSFNKDICTNDLNDIVLYFGDTSAQCNKPKNGEDAIPCLSNAECCGGSFCAFENETTCSDKWRGTTGKCLPVDNYGSGTGNNTKTITVNGVTSTWIKSSSPMTWWSAQNWCKGIGKSPTSRADLGCGDIAQAFCSDTDNVLTALQNAGWKSESGLYWLEDCNNDCSAYRVGLSNSHIGTNPRHTKFSSGTGRYALCH